MPQAQPVAVGSAEPFAWVDCKPRLLDGAPAVAVMFTQPLARSQDWGKLVKVTEGESASNASPVPGRWVLGDNPRMLYLPYVTPDRTYRIALDQALAAAGGGTLGRRKTARSRARPCPNRSTLPAGVVLPAGQNGGLPVVTVNTPGGGCAVSACGCGLAAHLPGARGWPPDQPADNSQPTHPRGEEGDYQDGYIDPGRRLKGARCRAMCWMTARAGQQRGYLGRFATDARPNRRNVSYPPVEKIKSCKEPGIYVAVMNPPGRFGLTIR